MSDYKNHDTTVSSGVNNSSSAILGTFLTPQKAVEAPPSGRIEEFALAGSLYALSNTMSDLYIGDGTGRAPLGETLPEQQGYGDDPEPPPSPTSDPIPFFNCKMGGSALAQGSAYIVQLSNFQLALSNAGLRQSYEANKAMNVQAQNQYDSDIDAATEEYTASMYMAGGEFAGGAFAAGGAMMSYGSTRSAVQDQAQAQEEIAQCNSSMSKVNERSAGSLTFSDGRPVPTDDAFARAVQEDYRVHGRVTPETARKFNLGQPQDGKYWGRTEYMPVERESAWIRGNPVQEPVVAEDGYHPLVDPNNPTSGVRMIRDPGATADRPVRYAYDDGTGTEVDPRNLRMCEKVDYNKFNEDRLPADEQLRIKAAVRNMNPADKADARTKITTRKEAAERRSSTASNEIMSKQGWYQMLQQMLTQFVQAGFKVGEATEMQMSKQDAAIARLEGTIAQEMQSATSTWQQNAKTMFDQSSNDYSIYDGLRRASNAG